MRVALLLCAAFALPAGASTFYVTVAGLGGEPDYEQRFTAAANDLDKLFRGAAGAHVYTLTGKQATRARVTEVLGSVAREAKPEDDLIVTLIGHGTFDGSEYKFNLVGPDISAAELAGLCDRVACEAGAGGQYDECEWWVGGCSSAVGAGCDRCHEVWYGEECHCVCAVLGGGAWRSYG